MGYRPCLSSLFLMTLAGGTTQPFSTPGPALNPDPAGGQTARLDGHIDNASLLSEGQDVRVPGGRLYLAWCINRGNCRLSCSCRA